ncbi:hypothetical protein SBV1_170021 [Verrucomicrobia bacterium]|nr:hypothetical protein SBV1_170021 [Verrucomicrobiota bacterium]
MHQPRIGARVEYLQEERERINDSASLAETFPDLKSLSAMLAYFGPGGVTRHSEIKHTFNLAYAKSLFRFNCPNPECVGGNFDLSAELAQSVAGHCGTASGEARCQGWQSAATINRVPCGHILRYQLSLGY